MGTKGDTAPKEVYNAVLCGGHAKDIDSLDAPLYLLGDAGYAESAWRWSGHRLNHEEHEGHEEQDF